MLQRVQTIFLFCVAVSMLLMLLFPIWEKGSIAQDQNEMIKIDAFKKVHVRVDQLEIEESATLEEEQPTFWIAVFAVLAIIAAITSIFKYKNRLTQIKFGALNSIIISCAMGFSLYYAMNAEEMLNPETQGAYKLGFFMPVAALLFNLLANRFIRKDEKLVKSVDRIR